MEDLEGSELADRRLLVGEGDGLDVGFGRALMAPANERVDQVLGSFGERLDVSIGEVSHPAADLEAASLSSRRRTKRHPLNGAVDAKMGAAEGH